MRAPEPRETAREYWLFALAIFISIFITSLFINSVPTALLTVSIGFAMVVFSLQLLSGVKLPVTDARIWQVGVGVFAGVLGGLVKLYLVASCGDVSAAAYGMLIGTKFHQRRGFCFWPDVCRLLQVVIAGVVLYVSLAKSLFGLISGIDRVSMWRDIARLCLSTAIQTRCADLSDYGSWYCSLVLH